MADGNNTENLEGTKPLVSHTDVHVLLLPYQDQGHINPLLHLGTRLAARGVRVTLALPKHVHDRFISSSRPDTSQQQSPNSIQIMGFKDGTLPDAPNIGPPQHAGDQSLEAGARALIEELASQGRPVTCIVSDIFWGWTRSLATGMKLPEFVFWPQNATVLSIFFNLDAISSAIRPFVDDDVQATEAREASKDLKLEANCFPGLPVDMNRADLPFDFEFTDASALVRHWPMNRISGFGEFEGVICNTFDALEHDAIEGLNSQFQKGGSHPLYGNCWPRLAGILEVGPLVPNVIFESDEHESGVSLEQEDRTDCLQWLDAQPAGSVLYVAFGTLRPLSSTQIRELALGLAASGKKILWVLPRDGMRPPHDNDGEGGPPGPGRGPGRGPGPGRGSDRGAGRGHGPGAGRGFGRPPPPPPGHMSGPRTSTSLEEILPAGFLEQNRDVCKVVDWAPQSSVLSHVAVGGFFSHCGWNSTLESVCSGVPILAWPSKMDQFTNSWLVTDLWKVGISLERDKDNTTKEMVEKGVRELMDGPLAPSMRARARELALEARKVHVEDSGVLSLVHNLRKASTA